LDILYLKLYENYKENITLQNNCDSSFSRHLNYGRFAFFQSGVE